MTLPNLFVPGAAKSATSSLHELLNQHPQIYMSKAKEPHFFSNADNFETDQTAKSDKLVEYMQLFSSEQEYTFRGESSTGYMVFPQVVERISKNISDPRFIFVLRNPIDRAYSHYWWLRGQGQETRPFREAIEADMYEPPDSKKRVKNFGGYRYYFAFGQYATYLQPFITTFGRERIFVMTTETLKRALTESINQCFAFLNLPCLHEINLVQANTTVVYQKPVLYKQLSTLGSQSFLSRFLKKTLSLQQYKQLFIARKAIVNFASRFLKKRDKYDELSKDDRQWLVALYKDEVQNLCSLTGLSFDEWARDFSI